MFLKSDIKSDNSLSLRELIEWVETNLKAMKLFTRYGKNFINLFKFLVLSRVEILFFIVF